MCKIFCQFWGIFSAILFKFINQGISWTLCSIHFWKAREVRINHTLAFLLSGDIWNAQNFNDSAGIKWRLYLRVHPRRGLHEISNTVHKKCIKLTEHSKKESKTVQNQCKFSKGSECLWHLVLIPSWIINCVLIRERAVRAL